MPVQVNLPSPTLLFNGAMVDQTSIQQNVSSLITNGQSSAGGVNFVASAAAAVTISSPGNLLLQLTNGGAVTVTLDSAYNMARFLPQPLTVGEQFTFNIMTNAGTTVATPTLTGTGITLAGTTTVTAAAMRWYQGVVTQVVSTVGIQTTAGTTFVSLAQVGVTNNFTLTLAGNTIVPVVGTLVYLNVTAGTLVSGWYPINAVTSATVFQIATPPGVVWTMTAGTIGVPVTLPQTIPLTPPVAGIYSPLITITGLMTTVTATMAV